MSGPMDTNNERILTHSFVAGLIEKRLTYFINFDSKTTCFHLSILLPIYI